MNAQRPMPFSNLRRGLCALVLASAVAWPQGAMARVMDASGWATQEAVGICQLLAQAHNVPVPAQAPGYAALNQLHAFAEANLRRPPGSERMDASAVAHYHNLVAPLSVAQRNTLQNLLKQLGDIGPVPPPPGTYDYILIHGSTVPSMRRRVMALAESFRTGQVHLAPGGTLVFLDGERPLFASETVDVLLDTAPYPKDPTFTPPSECPTNEREAAQMVWAQLELPANLRALTPLFVHGQALPGSARAHTRDVVRAWADGHALRAGRALMVSENPYVEYQRLITQQILREVGVCIEVVAMGGPGALGNLTSDTSLGVHLDNFAATLAEADLCQSLDERDIQAGATP